jgi:hypothetical protein
MNHAIDELTIESCPLCSAANLKPIEKSTWIECRLCGLQFPNFHQKSGIVTNQFPRKPPPRGTRLARSQARLALKMVGNRELIDFGCGNGSFLMAVLSHSKNGAKKMTGVEQDWPSVLVLESLGMDVSGSLPENIENSLLTMWHSAEHLPVQGLRDILIRTCKPSNRLLISVPNGDSTAWQIHREAFAFFDRESHFAQYSRKSLSQVLDDSGWKITKYHRSPYYGLFAAIQTTLNLNRPHNEIYNLVKRQGETVPLSLLIKSAIFLLGRAPQLLLMLLAELSTSRCSSLTVSAEPKSIQ